MGMFDEVNFAMDCPECGHRIDGFQTKDLACRMDTVEPDSLLNFYSACRGCGAWVEFTRMPAVAQPRREPMTEAQVLAHGFTRAVTPGRTKPENPIPSQGTPT